MEQSWPLAIHCGYIDILRKGLSLCKIEISKMKSKPIVWENIFANNTSGKGLISKIYEELILPYTRKTNNLI